MHIQHSRTALSSRALHVVPIRGAGVRSRGRARAPLACSHVWDCALKNKIVQSERILRILGRSSAHWDSAAFCPGAFPMTCHCAAYTAAVHAMRSYARTRRQNTHTQHTHTACTGLVACVAYTAYACRILVGEAASALAIPPQELARKHCMRCRAGPRALVVAPSEAESCKVLLRAMTLYTALLSQWY